MRVVFSSTELAEIRIEAMTRDKDMDVVGLGMDVSAGTSSRLERQVCGVAGEAAVLKALGRTIGGIVSNGHLDGGVDIRVGSVTLQVKAAMCSYPRWVYANEKGALRADVTVQTARIADTEHRIVGWRMTKDIEPLSEDVVIGGKRYKAMHTTLLFPIEQMLALVPHWTAPAVAAIT